VKDKLIERAGRRGYFRLTKPGVKAVESQPTFTEVTL
jgi:hypothetical protein